MCAGIATGLDYCAVSRTSGYNCAKISRIVRQSLMHIIGNLRRLLEPPNLEIHRSRLDGVVH